MSYSRERNERLDFEHDSSTHTVHSVFALHLKDLRGSGADEFTFTQNEKKMDVAAITRIIVITFLLVPWLQLIQAVELKYALFTATEGFDSSGAVPAIELAEEMVNKNSSILPGYTLTHTEVRDTKVSMALGLSVLLS